MPSLRDFCDLKMTLLGYSSEGRHLGTKQKTPALTGAFFNYLQGA
jgi:hypothetical protein